MPIRLVLIVTEVANLPLDADDVRKKDVVPVALSAADRGVARVRRGEASTTATTGDADA